MRVLREERGAALVTTIVAVVILAVLGVGVLSLTSSSYSMQASSVQRVSARLLAEGGAETAYQGVKTSSASIVYDQPFTLHLGFDSDNPTVNCRIDTQADGTYLITSTAASGKATSTVKLLAMPGLPLIYGVGVYAHKGIIGEGNNVVRGADIVSGGSVDGWSAPGHSIIEDYPMTFPTVDRSDYSSWPAPGDNGNKNDRVITIGASGRAWLPDDVEAKNNLTIVGPGILAVGAGLTEKNNLTIRGAVTLIVMGNLFGKNNLEAVEINGGRLNLVVTGDMKLKNNSEVDGSIAVGGTLEVGRNTEVRYLPPEIGQMPEVIGGPRDWERAWIR